MNLVAAALLSATVGGPGDTRLILIAIVVPVGVVAMVGIFVIRRLRGRGR